MKVTVTKLVWKGSSPLAGSLANSREKQHYYFQLNLHVIRPQCTFLHVSANVCSLIKPCWGSKIPETPRHPPNKPKTYTPNNSNNKVSSDSAAWGSEKYKDIVGGNRGNWKENLLAATITSNHILGT